MAHKCWTQIYNDKPISRCNPPPQKKEINCNLFDLFILLIKKMLKMCGCFTLLISLVPKTSEYKKIYPLQFPSMKPDFFQTPKQLSLPKYLE